MQLHLIVDFVDNNKALKSLSSAADVRNIPVNVLSVKEVDFLTLPTLEVGDLLYRHGLSERGREIERLLITDEVSHFYKTATSALGRRTSSYHYNVRAGLPAVKTVSLLPTADSDVQAHVDYLGGFPLVVKVMGGSKGVGVMRADSLPSLKSVLDYVRKNEDSVLLRSYVSHKYYGRLVVVGDSVVGSHRTFNMPEEFRTNAHGNVEKNKEGIEFPPEVQTVAVEAVRSLGVAFGGADMLFADDGNYHISEVNHPCSFTSTERIAKVDIAGPMLDYLVQKSQTLSSSR